MSTSKFTDFEKTIKRTSVFFELLSEPNRLGIYAILSYGPRTVSEIYDCLSLRQNLISHHLKVLKNLGLVSARKDGRRVYYSLDNRVLQEFKSSVFRVLQEV